MHAGPVGKHQAPVENTECLQDAEGGNADVSRGREMGTGFSEGGEGSQTREEDRGIATGELQSQPGLNCKVLRSRGAFAGSPGVRDSSARNVGKQSPGRTDSCPPWA